MVERNAEVAPDKRIEFRIGIHLGDIVEESDGDLMGDGVNIAARLEGIAAPGRGGYGCAREALRTRLDCDMRLLEQGLKDNVSTDDATILPNQRNWVSTCATAFELYWQLRYPFG